MLKVVNGLGIPVIDLEPRFQAESDPLSLFPFRKFGHYNERGNKLVAEAVLRTLADRELAQPGDGERTARPDDKPAMTRKTPKPHRTKVVRPIQSAAIHPREKPPLP